MLRPRPTSPPRYDEMIDRFDAVSDGRAHRGFSWFIALIAGIAATRSGAAPTGTPIWDLLLVAGLAAGFVLAARRAPTWVALVAATVATVVVRDATLLLPVGLGLAVMVVAVVSNRHTTLLQTIGAALAVQGLFRIEPVGFFGLPSIIAGLVMLAVFWSAYRTSSTYHRWLVRAIAVGVASLAVLICSVGTMVVITARTDLEDGLAAARSGVAAARDGEPEAVVAELAAAASSLERAQSRTSHILAKPMRLVPVASQHLAMVTTATAHGSELAVQAARSVSDANVSSITMAAGSVDLGALESMEPDLVDTAEQLEVAIEDLNDRRSGWLVPPVQAQVDDLSEELDRLAPEARVAADAAVVLPGLLGQHEPRRYFVAFGSPAESRELGGFVGSWAVLEFRSGFDPADRFGADPGSLRSGSG